MRILNVELYSGKVFVMDEKDFREWDLDNNDDYNKVLSSGGIVSYVSEEDIIIVEG
jgi:hypothetical protein